MFSFLLLLRSLFTIPQRTGAIRMNTTFLEGRLGLTHKRPNYQPSGTHLSPRSVLVWRSAYRLTSLSSTSRPTLCTPWSLTANTAPPHWVVTRGRSCLVHRPPCSSTVTVKGSMLWVLILSIQKQESASLEIMQTTASYVIPESGLEQEDFLMTPTRVETRQGTWQIMETNTSKPWVTSWCNERKVIEKL